VIPKTLWNPIASYSLHPVAFEANKLNILGGVSIEGFGGKGRGLLF